MRLNEQPLMPQLLGSESERRTSVRIFELLRAISIKVNAMAFGQAAGFDGGGTAAPTTGTWSQGDTWRNSAPVEAGIIGAKYVKTGWICTVGGTPGTWLEQRTLTGN